MSLEKLLTEPFVFEILLLMNPITFRVRSLRLLLRRSFTIPMVRSPRGVRPRRATGKGDCSPFRPHFERKRVSTKLSDSREIASKNCICCALLSRSVGLCHLSLLSPLVITDRFFAVSHSKPPQGIRVPFAPIHPRNSFLNSRSLSWNATVPCSWRHFALLNQTRESVDRFPPVEPCSRSHYHAVWPWYLQWRP